MGVVLNKKVGDRVCAGETLAYIHAADELSAQKAAASLKDCFEFSAEPVERGRFIKNIVF